jgi:hypothetical protein
MVLPYAVICIGFTLTLLNLSLLRCILYLSLFVYYVSNLFSFFYVGTYDFTVGSNINDYI